MTAFACEIYRLLLTAMKIARRNYSEVQAQAAHRRCHLTCLVSVHCA